MSIYISIYIKREREWGEKDEDREGGGREKGRKGEGRLDR